MADRAVYCYLKCFLLCTLLSLVYSLTLPYMVTTKPRHTKYTSSPAPGNASKTIKAVATTATKGIVLYRVATNDGATCVLLKTDGLIEVYFKHNGEEQVDTYMPDDADITGNCKYEDTASMRISWDGYTLIWTYAKTPGGERWYVDQIDLIISTELERYHTLRSYGKTFKLSHSPMMFPTPVGSSYSCEESIVELSIPENQYNPSSATAKIFLRKFQLQPFMYKGSFFGPVFDCNARLAFRDETAPIAVGSTLAIAVLGTVTGYGIFRYFKIKKVQYNTME